MYTVGVDVIDMALGQDRTDGPNPISRLHEDILWHIFSLNTPVKADFTAATDEYYREPEHCLITTRHTSQVCAGWRELMLASPSLWANVINLQHLDQENSYWCDEILKRSGKSPLSVKGVVEKGSPATPFFLGLLGGRWTQIRRLSIQVKDDGVIEDDRWSSLRLPAPNLEFISVVFPSPPRVSTTRDVLFSNDAPSIHTIIIHSVNFNLSGPWLSRVRHLDLFDCSVGHKIIHALSEMVSLEALVITNVDISIGTANSHWPTIILPRLNYIDLFVDIRTLIALLGHIKPTLGSSLQIESVNSVNDTLPFLSSYETLLLERGFAAHFQCFSDYSRNEVISCEITEKMFYLKNILNSSKSSELLQPPGFYFYIDFKAARQEIACSFLNSLSSCNSNSIKTLELVLRAVPDSSHSALIKFYHSLTSVEIMLIDSKSLELLANNLELHDAAGGMTLFPRLHTIVFDSGGFNSDLVTRFLTRRRDLGIAIRNFALHNCTSESPSQEQILFMEELGVQWNQEFKSNI